MEGNQDQKGRGSCLQASCSGRIVEGFEHDCLEVTLIFRALLAHILYHIVSEVQQCQLLCGIFRYEQKLWSRRMSDK